MVNLLPILSPTAFATVRAFAGKLPPELGSLIQLEELNLNDNGLEGAASGHCRQRRRASPVLPGCGYLWRTPCISRTGSFAVEELRQALQKMKTNGNSEGALVR